MSFGPINPALLTDQYELTMAAAYFDHGRFDPATFSLFIREYPPDRGYFVSAGLERVLDYLENFHFDPADIDALAADGRFSESFLQYLSELRFTGHVHAMPEGQVFFRDEPVLEVTAPIIEAQLVETFVINAVNLPVSIATKAARCVDAADGRRLVDFSLRRTQGMDAGLTVARSSYLAGFSGTSNVGAGVRYGIPVFGTMAHSFVTSFPDETEAFEAFAETFPENTVLLIDTYDTRSGARKAVEVARGMVRKGHRLRGVRLDSGDMARLSRDVRTILDGEGYSDVEIFASGGFDEHKIEDVISRQARIDAFGVGTKMGVSADAPYTDIAYKLVRYANRPVLKLSSGKRTLVGEKQVFRRRENGKLAGDLIALRGESPAGEALLGPVMDNGRRSRPAESLETIRDRCAETIHALPPGCRQLRAPDEYPVTLGVRRRDKSEGNGEITRADFALT